MLHFFYTKGTSKHPNVSCNFCLRLFVCVHRWTCSNAIQRYISGLGGGMGPSVGPNATYSPKELNKEVMPEKVT